MIWDKNLERLEKYMDKQMDKQTENKMSREDHINVLRTMAIGRTEKETIEYAIKQIKQAKKWRRKARIEYQRGYEDAKKEFIGMSAKQIQIKYHDDFATALEKMYEYEERQTEKTCDNCLFHGHCQYYGKTLTWLFGDKNEQTGEKVCKSWKPDGSKLRKESHEV